MVKFYGLKNFDFDVNKFLNEVKDWLVDIPNSKEEYEKRFGCGNNVLTEGKMKSNVKSRKDNRRPIAPPPCPKPKGGLIESVRVEIGKRGMCIKDWDWLLPRYI
jgi:hypothetical protein